MRTKKHKWAVTVVASLTILMSMSTEALACACCSNENEYRINFRQATSYERGIMRDLKFGAAAQRSESPASDAAPATYALSGGLTGNAWNLNFRDGNRNGSLTLTLPLKMLSYVVDTHDGQTSDGGGPRLYKEWRFEGRANATGFLRSGGSTPTSYFLVFQGRGNRCDNAGDFSHWRLELKGARGRYTLTGELTQPTASVR